MSLSKSQMTVVRGAAQSQGDEPAPKAPPTATGTPIQPMGGAPTEDPTKRADNPAPDVKASGAGTPKDAAEKKEGEPKSGEPKKEDDAASRFAVLARRESKLVKDSQALKLERDTITAEKTKLETERAAFVKAQGDEAALWESDPIQALEKRGYSYEDITNIVLGKGEPKKAKPPDLEKTIEEKLAEREAKQKEEAEKKRIKDAEDQKTIAAKELEEARAEWRRDFSAFVEKPEHAEKYEYINLYKDLALEIGQALMEQMMTGKKKVLTDEEAATLVEDHLFLEFEKGTKTKKYQAKAQPQPKEDPKQPLAKVKVDDASDPAKPRTLTTRLTPSSTPKAELSWEERLARARAVKVSRA